MLRSPSKAKTKGYSRPELSINTDTSHYAYQPRIQPPLPPPPGLGHTLYPIPNPYIPTNTYYNPHTFPSTSAPTMPPPPLVFPPTLLQKIHDLMLIRRQIEYLARWMLDGRVAGAETTKRMRWLEEKYEVSREEVESGLEAVWVNSGYIPPLIPAAPMQTIPVHHKKGHKNSWEDSGYTVDKALKRKHEAEQNKRQGHEKKRKSDTGAEWVQTNNVQPIGVQCSMIPLTYTERRRMTSWKMSEAWQNGVGHDQVKGDLVSPRGSQDHNTMVM